MYMYVRKCRRSFDFFPALASRRASDAHDGIVKSSISYGAYLLEVTFACRNFLGSRLSGIGYTNWSFCFRASGSSAAVGG